MNKTINTIIVPINCININININIINSQFCLDKYYLKLNKN